MRRAWTIVLAGILAAVLVQSVSAASGSAWLTTRTGARADLLGGRFPNIASVACEPDRQSATQVFGQTRYWQRFWCSGRTFDGSPFRLKYKATGRCDACWTVMSLSGVSVGHLKSASAPNQQPSLGGGIGSASCPSGWYRNVYGNCIPGPSNDPGLLPGGPTAQCVDGTYSYSQTHSGTCSHHGGVARWLSMSTFRRAR